MRTWMLCCTVLISGCAMTEARYRGLEHELASRTEKSQTEALTAFFARERLTDGYGDGWVTRLEHACPHSPFRKQNRDTFDLPRNGAVAHLVFPPGALDALCDGQQEVSGTLDGTPVTASRTPEFSWARDAQGQLVSYSLKKRVVRSERVLVKMTCDHFPDTGGPPLPWIDVATTPPRPVRHFEVPFDAWELRASCTENTS